jgi:mannose-1-phosphate guanylyltransferase/mannose-6-phosphate isomerase
VLVVRSHEPATRYPLWWLGRAALATDEDYRFITAEQLRQAAVVPAAIVLDPIGRNPAPALTLAALFILQGAGDPVLVAMPSDWQAVLLPG